VQQDGLGDGWRAMGAPIASDLVGGVYQAGEGPEELDPGQEAIAIRVEVAEGLPHQGLKLRRRRRRRRRRGSRRGWAGSRRRRRCGFECGCGGTGGMEGGWWKVRE
jgi:hypothetical protein